jgi:1-acyl-sn-glycerol-3-phosphate acyltransferase
MSPQALRRILFFLFRLFSRIEISGIENIPKTGGVLIASNHLGILDGPLIYAVLPRADCTALAADKYHRNPFSRWLLNTARVIWLDRDNPDPQTFKTAIQRLREGWVLGIAPEGTRSKTGALIAAKPGVAYLAAKAGVPTLVMAVTGTEDAGKAILRLRKPRFRVVFGEIFDLPPLDRHDRDAALQRNADEMMCRIAALLPEKYRGVYADHPRLAEILRGEKA